jgi:hypothetical protein
MIQLLPVSFQYYINADYIVILLSLISASPGYWLLFCRNLSYYYRRNIWNWNEETTSLSGTHYICAGSGREGEKEQRAFYQCLFVKQD